jgi:eukaryotic-like serine/threonine-protein kinase
MTGHRYNAACSAALAGAGRGEDPPPEEADRARWRKQAVTWLQADLTSWRHQVEARRPYAAEVAGRALRRWKENADLAGLRDPEALARLPADEQTTCRQLWADVDALLARVGPS